MRITIYFLLLEKNHGTFKHWLWLTAWDISNTGSSSSLHSTHPMSVLSALRIPLGVSVCLNSYLNGKDFHIFSKRSVESMPEGSYADKMIKSKSKQIQHFQPFAGTHPVANAHRSLFPVRSPKATGGQGGLNVQPRCSAPGGEHSWHGEHHSFSGQ